MTIINSEDCYNRLCRIDRNDSEVVPLIDAAVAASRIAGVVEGINPYLSLAKVLYRYQFCDIPQELFNFLTVQHYLQYGLSVPDTPAGQWRSAVSDLLVWEHSRLEKLASKTKSPIEKMFLEACFGCFINAVPQVAAGSYMLDFEIIPANKPPKRVGVEIDGHEYHKTKEQRTKDAIKERWLEKNGWQIVRFTGNEVYKSAINCVGELCLLIGEQ